jgi:hypothetical protein
VLADQPSAGRPQAGDAEVVQRAPGQSQIASVHAVIRGFAQAASLRPLIRTQNPAVKIFGEDNRGADTVDRVGNRFGNLNYNAGSS